MGGRREMNGRERDRGEGGRVGAKGRWGARGDGDEGEVGGGIERAADERSTLE
jgi:hypothetical protein